MQDITIAQKPVNIEALDADLRAALGSTVAGISTGPYGVEVHLSDDATPTQLNQARSIVQAHDATKLSAQQQAEVQREAQLEQARQDNATSLNVSDYSGQNALIQKLAQKIAWLEQEIADLRG
jgi:hypothetical protein